jgi:uncharacterized protein
MDQSLLEVFGKHKPVIGMVHFPPLPGTPLYDEGGGLDHIRASVEADLEALQDGGIDAVMFGNEGDRPYLTSAGLETVAIMTSVIASLTSHLRVPFGVDVLWDPKAAIAVAMATGARFVREVFTGLFAGDLGLWTTACGEALRYRRSIGAEHVRLLYTINAEFASPVDARDIGSVARSVVFSSIPDGICVSGPMTGESGGVEQLRIVKVASGTVPVFANTGVTADSVASILEVCDGAIVGTYFKRDGVTWNPVDVQRVEKLMTAARAGAARSG